MEVSSYDLDRLFFAGVSKLKQGVYGAFAFSLLFVWPRHSIAQSQARAGSVTYFYFDALEYIRTLFMAAGGFAVILGLPLLGSKLKAQGLLPLFIISLVLAVYWLNRNYF